MIVTLLLVLDLYCSGIWLIWYFLPPGKISPWTGRFYSLLDPSYAKNNIPIIASVSEHQPTTWSSYYFDLQLLVFMFPGKCCWNMPIHHMFVMLSYVFFFSFLTVGLYYCFSNLSDARIFIIMYGVTSMYFSAVMVCPVIIWKDIFRQSICLPRWFLHILSLPLKKLWQDWFCFVFRYVSC